jgi:4a-hydroxytetrahydrobiopterin dehydratase
MATDLAKKECIPCTGGVPPLPQDKIQELLRQVPGWRTERDHHLTKEYKFPDFVQALAAVNRIGALAEQQGHHPDLYLAWGKVRVEIWTHKIDGLTESDFILAAKIEEIV